MPRSRNGRGAAVVTALLLAGTSGVVLVAVLLAAVVGNGEADGSCSVGVSGTPGLMPGGPGQVVGASEYGGPGDPASGVFGSSGADLRRDPDSYAELGGTSFDTARAMGGLPYGTPLRISWARRSVVAYKRDIGFGGGPVAGRPRVIDLWWELAGSLGIPYERGEWSGAVRVQRPPATGAAVQLAATPAPAPADGAPAAGALAGCPLTPRAELAVTAGARAVLLLDGQAAAPASAPAAIRAMIAAGNQIAGRPYVYGGAHGVPLSGVWPAYDCSSSVDHILWGAGLLAAADTFTSGTLESFGAPGPGRWVTLYASAEHVFMYVAGLRWDTWNAAGAGDGGSGIGWHPLVRDAAGFVARHPVGL